MAIVKSYNFYFSQIGTGKKALSSHMPFNHPFDEKYFLLHDRIIRTSSIEFEFRMTTKNLKKISKRITMKRIALITLVFALSLPSISSGEKSMNDALRYDLAKPLLIIKGKRGFLACAYINPETCNKTGEACAIVSGVNDYDDMKEAKIIAVSESAGKLGIKVGDSGQKALEVFK